MWKDVQGKALLANAADVSMHFDEVKADSGPIEVGLVAASRFSGKKWSDGQASRVEVKLVNKLDMSKEAPKPLVLGATTATLGNDLASAGNDDTKAAAETGSAKGYVPGAVDYVMDAVLFLFEECAPQLDWDPVDVVPKERLSSYRPMDKPCH